MLRLGLGACSGCRRVAHRVHGADRNQLAGRDHRGARRALWFTESSWEANQIGRITTGGAFTEFGGLSAPRQYYSGPIRITSGPDGRLWFTEFDANKIGAITTGGVLTEYSTGLTPGAAPAGITVGPDGRLWFTEFNARPRNPTPETGTRRASSR